MGGTPCKIIIMEGNIAYAVVETIADKFHHANTLFLEAAIQASCNVVSFNGLYSAITHTYNAEYDAAYEKIINIHSRIINELPLTNKGNVQRLMDELTDELVAATRELYLPYEEFVPSNLAAIRASLDKHGGGS